LKNMKTTFKIALLVLVSFSLISSTCSTSDDDDGFNTNVNQQQVVSIAQSGNCTITYFFDTDSDEANNVNGYTFNFGNGSVLTAVNGTNTITGPWSVTNGSSNDDSSSDVDFNIFFASPANFNELSEDWHIISHSSTKIELIHISGGNGGTDYLTFEKQ